MAAEMWYEYESDLKLNINKEELGLYLAVSVSRDKLAELGIADFCHVWKSVQGAHPGISEISVKFCTEMRKLDHSSINQSESQAIWRHG